MPSTASSPRYGFESSAESSGYEPSTDNGGQTPRLTRLAEQAESLARRSADALRDGSHQLRAKAEYASDQTAGYIRDEPFKSVLIAAAVGAALMGLAALLGRRHSH
jgi:ElaB/YqjD/DUF883 family membrane-anchored ribosome-binding protein